MSTFTQSARSSKSTNFDTNFTPIQSGAAIALGFGLSTCAVAAKFNLHRSTILTNPDASPSVRLKAALAVLKQDWKRPHSTDFDTFSQQSDELPNEMPPDSPDN